MNCSTCGSPLSQTRCGKNSRLICPKGHVQPSPATLRMATTLGADWVAKEAVDEQGIGD